MLRRNNLKSTLLVVLICIITMTNLLGNTGEPRIHFMPLDSIIESELFRNISEIVGEPRIHFMILDSTKESEFFRNFSEMFQTDAPCSGKRLTLNELFSQFDNKLESNNVKFFEIKDPALVSKIKMNYDSNLRQELDAEITEYLRKNNIFDIISEMISEKRQLQTNEMFSNEAEAIPVTSTELIGNYPNPFNPVTSIRFNLASPDNVRLDVYNSKGQKVTTIVDKQFGAGQHTVTWNGTDHEGRNVGSGVYFYRLTTSDTTQLNKMLLLK